MVGWITKDVLYDLYVNQKYSLKAIGKQFNKGYFAVQRLAKIWQIPLRSQGECHRKYHSTDELEKARVKCRHEYWNRLKENEPEKYKAIREKTEKWKVQHLDRTKEISRKCTQKIVGHARRFVNAVAMFLGCERCGYNGCPSALEFHHRDPKSKKFAIVHGVSRGKKIGDLAREILKCDCLCANCHREVHWEKKHGDLECN